MHPSIGLGHFRVAIDHVHIARMRYWGDFSDLLGKTMKEFVALLPGVIFGFLLGVIAAMVAVAAAFTFL
jgi:hypothetical protein